MSFFGVKLVPFLKSSDGHQPSDHPVEGLTFLGLSHSIRLSLPVDKTSRWNGSSFYKFRINSVITGVGTACFQWLTWWAFSFILYDWMFWLWVELRLLGDNYLRIQRTARYIDFFHGSGEWHFWNWAIWLSWLAFLHGMVPVYWRLSADVAMRPHFLSIVAALIQYVESDEPLGWQRLSLDAQLDAAIGFYLTTWLLADGARILAWPRWVIFWITDMIIYETGYQLGMGVGMYLTWPWEELKQNYRATTEITLLCAFIAVPFAVYKITQRMSADRWSSLLQSSPSFRYLHASWIKMMSLLDLFDLIGAAGHEFLQAYFQRTILSRQQEFDDNGLQPYTYEPLEDGQIRLLVIRKAKQGYRFDAEIIHRPLGGGMQYEALSYRWANSDLTHMIKVSGHGMLITKSAFDLIVSRMSFFHERVLWIDAICVNQQDKAEKAVQVPLMTDIYRHAQRVVLIPSVDPSYRIAADLIYELGTAYTSADPEYLHGRGLPTPMYQANDQLAVRWEAFAKLIRESYFTRAWIVQEIASGQVVQLLLGGIYVPWAVFHEAVLKLHNPRFGATITAIGRKSSAEEGQPALSKVMCINAIRPDSINGARGDLLSPTQLSELAPILAIVSDFVATDERDKVYSVAGMTAHFKMSKHLTVDYTKDVAEVYTDAAKAVFLNFRPAIDMLTFAGVGWERKVQTASWVPHLSRPLFFTSINDVIQSTKRFQAGGKGPAKMVQGVFPHYLDVAGGICDTILDLGDVLELPEAIHTAVVQAPMEIMSQIYDQLCAAKALTVTYADALAPGADIGAAVSGDGLGGVVMPSNAFEDLLRGLHRMISAARDTQIRSTDQQLRDWWHQWNKLNMYYLSVTRTMIARRFGITEAGRLCVVPPKAQAGDKICILQGAQTPYVVDNRCITDGNGTEWLLIGECYVQGIMQGELLDELDQASMLTFL